MEFCDTCESSSSTTSRDDKLEALELLDEYWFYKNLFHGRTRMSRASSDPYPSSNKIQNMGLENSTTTNLPIEDGFVRCDLLRIPSLPPCIEKETMFMEKEIDCVSISKLDRQSSLNYNLLRTPSFPSTIEKEKNKYTRVKDSNRVTSKLTPQASISCNLLRSPSLPPCIGREKVSRGVEISSKLTSIYSSRELPSQKAKIGSATKAIKNNPYITKDSSYGCEGDKKSWKSLSELEFEEVQGFKDLGFIFDEKDLDSNVVNIIPGLQGKRADDGDEERVTRPYLSEAWLLQSSAPPLPNWVDGRSMEDMKTLLKFWARAVASNMRQGS